MSNSMYGYQDDNVSVSPVNFGLNAGVCKLVKFEWTPNGGKEGAEMEALDIVFNINDKDFNYRQFPVTKTFDNQTEITDPNHPKMKEAAATFNALMTHLILCFISREEYVKAITSKPIPDFKTFCKMLMFLLPKNFAEIPLDIFFQYQWTIKGENTRTFYEIPKNLKHGKFLCPHVKPVGQWQEVKMKDPSTSAKNALFYKDDAGNIHPFVRTGWFMNSNFAKAQVEEGTTSMTTENPIANPANSEEGQW